MQPQLIGGVKVSAPVRPEYSTILTPEALQFVAHLSRRFSPRVTELLQRRVEVQARFDAGAKPKFLEETRHVSRGIFWMLGGHGKQAEGSACSSPRALNSTVWRLPWGRQRSLARRHRPRLPALPPLPSPDATCPHPPFPTHLRHHRFVRVPGQWPPSPPTSWTGAWRSRAPPTARW